MPDARLISAKEEEFLETNQFICEHLFKEKESISFEDIKKLR